MSLQDEDSSQVKNIIFTTAIVGDLIVFDQVSKFLAMRYLDKPYEIINGIFSLVFSRNRGIAFGIEMPFNILIAANILILFLIIYTVNSEINLSHTISKIFTAMIIAGGISNLIDRIFRGSVIDFISIWEWPVFNLADIYITIGILAILVFHGKIRRIKKINGGN